ncbi:MAG TPA: hypothetical protein VKK79_00815, partial [Candidatus Lokiarchaeia archaeon]|nr:hypothetical protein [Candidatus Lokiarchaeia archaeon]
LAIFYEGSTPIWAHGAASTAAIYGLGACMFFMFWVFTRKKMLANVWPKWWSLGIVYGEVLLVVGLMTLFSNYATLFSGWDINHGFFRADIFWEWLLVAALFLWVIGSFFIIKDEKKTPTSKTNFKT